jgi:hypothetical protein
MNISKSHYKRQNQSQSHPATEKNAFMKKQRPIGNRNAARSIDVMSSAKQATMQPIVWKRQHETIDSGEKEFMAEKNQACS